MRILRLRRKEYQEAIVIITSRWLSARSPRALSGLGTGVGEEEGEPLLPDMAKLAGIIRRDLDIRDRSYRLKTYHSVFIGSDLVTLLLELGTAENREYATQLGRALWTAGYFHHVHDDHQFNDRGFFYRFYCDEDSFVQRDTIQWLKHRAPKMPQLRWTALPSLVQGDSCEPTVWRIQPHTALNSIVMDPTDAGASFDGAEGKLFQETLRQRVCHLLGDPARRRGRRTAMKDVRRERAARRFDVADFGW